MRKYFLYARKSTDTEDKQVLSIEAQLVELKMFLKTIQDACIVEEFIETRTAKEPGRPIFNKMLSRIEKGEAEGIISWHPDRLARNAVDGGKIIHLIDQNHVKYLDFPNYRFDNTPQGKFMLSIIFGQSKYYVDNLSENVKRGIRQKLRRGEWPGQAHLGYVNNLKTKKIDIEPNLGPKVRQLFETYSTGKCSLSSMICYATSIGLLSRVTNRPITKHAIQKMLSNPIYIGKIKYDGEIYDGTHEPLISEELYYKVQDVMKKKSRPIKVKHKFHFTRLIKCKICGSMITAEAHKGFIYYRCVKKKAKCCSKYIRQELLVNQINKSFKKVLLSNILQKGLKNKVKEEKEIIKNDSQKELDLLNDNLKNVDNQVSRLMDIYLEGEISKRETVN